MKLKGITKRWVTNTLLVTALIFFVVCTVSVTVVIGYYRNYVSVLLSGYANENVTAFFKPYVDSAGDTFEVKSREFVESFGDNSLMEVQVIDKNGKVVVSSTGFSVAETFADMDDVQKAVKAASGICKWTGFNSNGEHIMSVAMVLPQSETGFSGAVRFLTSLRGVDRQLVVFALLTILVYLIAMTMVTVSGVFFIRTIVAPVRRINETAKAFADGQFDVRLDTGDESDEDEISELASSINDMIAEVAATDKLKNDFISTVSHELRTPLTAIKGWGEMLKELDGEDRELSRRGTEVIISESERLSQLVEELLDFSRMQNGTMSLRLEKTDVLAELDEAIFVFKERSKRDGIELVYSVPETPAPMNADPNRIKQVFVNILDNAFKYTKQGGTVEVAAVCSDNTLTINFSDTGCGISAEDLPNVKKKFYKANLKVRGSGIGLAVVDEIIKLHNGVFEINSELDVGTTVTIALPIIKTNVEENKSVIQEMAVKDNEQRTEENA